MSSDAAMLEKAPFVGGYWGDGHGIAYREISPTFGAFAVDAATSFPASHKSDMLHSRYVDTTL